MTYQERRDEEQRQRYELIQEYIRDGKQLSVADVRFARLYEFAHGKGGAK